MRQVIPFTKDIFFEKKVCEITSISLEHEITTEDGLLKGNFIISGDFKSHEVSVNKEVFSYILPFEITLVNDRGRYCQKSSPDQQSGELQQLSYIRIYPKIRPPSRRECHSTRPD